MLLSAFPQELLFPAEFVGRGDMSRGGLLLRSVDAHLELAYVPVRGAALHGARPPKLPPRSTRILNHHPDFCRSQRSFNLVLRPDSSPNPAGSSAEFDAEKIGISPVRGKNLVTFSAACGAIGM